MVGFMAFVFGFALLWAIEAWALADWRDTDGD
jgi:hypothetical protein